MKRIALLLLGIYAVIQFAALVPQPATAVECNLAVNANNPICVGGGCYKMEWTGNGTSFNVQRRTIGGGPIITFYNRTSPFIDCPPSNPNGYEYQVIMICSGSKKVTGGWQGRVCN